MLIVIIAGGIVLVFVIAIYNSLIAKKNQIKNIFGTLDAMLKKRYDLVPNLVATVKGYASHEKSLLDEVTKMRSRALSPNVTDDEKVALDAQITKTLSSIMLTVEAYPDLKANENFLHLQRSLTELEEQISAARRAYNASVTDFNNAVEMFPTNIVASMMNYKRKKLFEIIPAQRSNVNVKDIIE